MAASRREIRAVRRVLYERRRLRRLYQHASSIDVLMNTDPGRALSPDDTRVQGGAGPGWVIPGSGELSVAVLDAADRCDEIAKILLAVRRDLADVDFDRSDKHHLRAGLASQASAWRARGRAWRAPGPPGNIRATVAGITKRERASMREFRSVREYLREVDPRSLA